MKDLLLSWYYNYRSDMLTPYVELGSVIILVIVFVLILWFIYFIIYRSLRIFNWALIKSTRILHTSSATRSLRQNLLRRFSLRSLISLISVLTIFIISNALAPIFFIGVILDFVVHFSRIAILLYSARIINFCIGILGHYYDEHRMPSANSISTFIQIIQISLIILAILFGASILFKKSLLALIGTISAIAAVVMFMFKEHLLSVIASIQLTSTRDIEIGNWVQFPAHSVDGEISDISLQNMHIQNWDSTVVRIPLHLCNTDSFINLSKLKKLGTRRIKQQFFLDIHSIVMITRQDIIDMCQKYTVFDEHTQLFLLNKYDEHAKIYGAHVNNLLLFMDYMRKYLRGHPNVTTLRILMVRLLQYTIEGMPVELYCFSNVYDWVRFEQVQSDIIAHALFSIQIFGLQLFQRTYAYDTEHIAMPKTNFITE